VHIAWRTTPGQGGWLSWVETGGPPMQQPSRRSFGTMLLEQVVPQDFGGTGAVEYRPAGLVYRLEVPPA
jgi:two-component sensor histidine kinase